VPKVEECCLFYNGIAADAESAAFFCKETFSLRALRFCGELVYIRQ